MIKIEIPSEDSKYYAELDLTMRRAWNSEECIHEDGYEAYDCDSFFIPSGLSDQDKFICALIYHSRDERGLTSKPLMEWFGWTKYKCRKLARENKYSYTTALICEEGGYGGKGWVLLPDMIDAMREYRESTYPCKECKQLVEHVPRFNAGGVIGYCACDTWYRMFENSGCRTGRFEKEGGGNEQ